MTFDRAWPALRRAVTFVAIAAASGVAMAGPAIHSEIDNPYAAGIRVLIGLICGTLGAPIFAAAAWRKRLVPAVVSVYVPPIGAAVLSRLAWSDDYSLTHIALPLSYVTTLVTFFVVPDRAPAEGRCPACGYDLRADPDGRCPECGATPHPPAAPAVRRWRRVQHGALLVLAMIVCGILHTLFIRGLLSLG